MKRAKKKTLLLLRANLINLEEMKSEVISASPTKKYRCAKKVLLTIPLRKDASIIVTTPIAMVILFLGIVKSLE
jgi:hypothetical protein